MVSKSRSVGGVALMRVSNGVYSTMRLPPFFKDLPNDAVRRVVELLNQPQIVQTVKDAAQQVGATTEWGTAQLQDSLQQAKRWIDSVSGRWTAHAPSATAPIVNATGEIFSNKWSSPALTDAAAAAYSRVSAGYSDDSSIRSETEKLLMDATGAESALVVHNIATALQCAAIHPDARDGWVIPRSAAMRLHDGGDVFSIFQRFGKTIEIGAVNTCSADDLAGGLAESSGEAKKALFSLSPSISDNDEAGQGAICELFLQESKKWNLPLLELRYDGSLCDLRKIVATATPVQERISAGVAAVVMPGDAFLGGPRCGIIVGKASFVEPMREAARTLGFAASSIINAILLGSLPHNQSSDAWENSPTGASFMASMANQTHRAQRIAEQIKASRFVKSIEVSEVSCAIGPAPWTNVVLPSALITIVPASTCDEVMTQLRRADRLVVPKISHGTVQLYMRTIDPADDRSVVSALGVNEQPTEAEQTN